MKTIVKFFGILLAFSIVIALCTGGYSYVMTFVNNKINHEIQKVDDKTNYQTRKKVEDTCRAIISSYMSDKATWEQYKDSESELERSWSSQAMMRANKSAISYNEYILKNSYVWEGNIPSDINRELPLLTNE